MAYSKYDPPAGYRLPAQPYSRFGYDGNIWIPGKLGKGFALFPAGGTVQEGAAAPAIFLSGQSNAGNRDTVPGTTNPPHIHFTYTYDGVTFVGPGPMVLQGPDQGHSFEWQCSTNVSIAFDSEVYVAKQWADSTTIGQWAVGQAAWQGLATALENFALQCVAANVSQVEFGWCQGESNCQNNQTSTLASFQSDTSDLFDSVKYLLEGYGLSVHFTVLKTNAGIPIGPNPTDFNATSLTSVRASQTALGSSRTDTTVIDFPLYSFGVHYGNGQTNVNGAQWAASIISRYTAAQPAFTTPPTVEIILGANLVFHYDSRAIGGLVNGDPVGLWPDIGGGSHNSTQTGTARPTYRTNALGTIPEVDFDGVNDTMPVPGLSFAAPGTTPMSSIWVGRSKSWTQGNGIWGSTSNTACVMQWDVTPRINPSIATSPTNALNLPIGTFGRVETQFSNGATDYEIVSDAKVVTGSVGNAAFASLGMAQVIGARYGNVGQLCWIMANSVFTKLQRDKLRGYGFANYTRAVWGVQ